MKGLYNTDMTMKGLQPFDDHHIQLLDALGGSFHAHFFSAIEGQQQRLSRF